MKVVIRRVRNSRVTVRGSEVGRIAVGLVVLVGFGENDTMELPESPVWDKMLGKLLDMRIFPDPEDRMKLSLKEWGGEILLVPQFTLHADLSKGRRPSFHLAAEPDTAKALFDRLVADMKERLPEKVATGEFGANMNVELTNWGPVTILVDSEDL